MPWIVGGIRDPPRPRGLGENRGREFSDGRLAIQLHRVAAHHAADRAGAVASRTPAPACGSSTHFWAIPIIQVIHILAISASFASILMINARMFGIAGSSTMAETASRYIRVLWWALVVLVLSGIADDHRRAGPRADQPDLLDQDGAGRVRRSSHASGSTRACSSASPRAATSSADATRLTAVVPRHPVVRDHAVRALDRLRAGLRGLSMSLYPEPTNIWESIEYSSLGITIAESTWMFPTLETLHVIALVTVLGMIAHRRLAPDRRRLARAGGDQAEQGHAAVGVGRVRARGDHRRRCCSSARRPATSPIPTSCGRW